MNYETWTLIFLGWQSKEASNKEAFSKFRKDPKPVVPVGVNSGAILRDIQANVHDGLDSCEAKVL